MIDFLNNLDTTIFLAVNGAHSPFFDNFMTLFTSRYIWIPMYLTAIFVIFKGHQRKPAYIHLAALIAAILLTDQTCASVIRPAVERLRPSNIDSTISHLTYIVNGYRGGPYGFPSCHAANSFALCVFLALFVKRRYFTLFILSWAILNSYSRLYLGVHYPGDLIVGAVVGAVFGAICHTAANIAVSRLTKAAAYPDSPSSEQITEKTPDPGFLQKVTGADMMMTVFLITLVIIAAISAIS